MGIHHLYFLHILCYWYLFYLNRSLLYIIYILNLNLHYSLLYILILLQLLSSFSFHNIYEVYYYLYINNSLLYKLKQTHLHILSRLKVFYLLLLFKLILSIYLQLKGMFYLGNHYISLVLRYINKLVFYQCLGRKENKKNLMIDYHLLHCNQ